jgi:hypothetical protein
MMQEEVAERSHDLRTSTDAMFVRIRALLAERGLDPSVAELAQMFQDDSAFQFGILVAGDGRVYQFGFDHLHRSVTDGVFVEWNELTDGWQMTPHRDEIAVALSLQGRASHGS